MFQPGQAYQVHIIAQRVVSEGEAVDIVAGIAGVHPGAQDYLFLMVIMVQIQCLSCSHPIIIKPSGHDQGRYTVGFGALLPVPALPQFIIVHVLKPLFQKRYIVSQGFWRQFLQGADIEDLIPVLPGHQQGIGALARNHEGPGQHA